MRVKSGIRVLSIAAVCIALSVFLAGCREEEANAPVEITFFHGWGGTLKTHDTMQGIYSQFSDHSPGVSLKSTPYSDSSIAVEKANDMLAAGKMPDIISTNGRAYYVSNAVKRNMAMDLMPYIQKDPELRTMIHPSVLETWTTEDGSLYTVPDALEIAGYWYNEAYIRQAGVQTVPTTWEEFFAMTEKLKAWIDETGQEVSVCSMDQVQMSEGLFLARLAGENDNGLAAAGSSSVPLESQTVINTMNDLDKLCRYSEHVGNIENARQNFSDGKSILYFNGVWESDAMSEGGNKQNFRYAAYPTSSGQSLAYISASSGYVLAKQSDKKKADACINFLKYMLSEKVQMKMAVQTGQAPSNPQIDNKKVEKENPLFGSAISAVYEADIRIKTIWSVWPEEKLQIVQEYCQAILQNRYDSSLGEEMTGRLNGLK